MFEIEEVDSALNIFSESRRPLNIVNLNSPPAFKPISTRIPAPHAIKDKRKEFTETVLSHKINKPFEDDQQVDPSDQISVETDHFYRDFQPFTLPTCLLDHVPLIHNKNTADKVKPQWHLDVPTTNMSLQPKITYHDVVDPKMKHELPNCIICGEQLSYPFYASLQHNLCPTCYSQGRLPKYTSTKDFYIINKPLNKDESWTLTETNKLLSLIEEYGDDWQTISQEMRTKTPSECLLQFVRLPIIDQYYIDDPLSVEECNDDMTQMLPFMMAPHPIATLVEFIHILNHKLGSVIAEHSQKIIEERLKANSSMIPFTQVPEILQLIINATQKEAGKLADEEAEAANYMLTQIMRKLQFKVQELFVSIEKQIKQSDLRAAAMGFSVSGEEPQMQSELLYNAEDLSQNEADQEEEEEE